MAQDNSDILEMSDEELMAEWDKLGPTVLEGKERLRAFSAEHQRRTEAARIQQLLGPMTEEQKQAAINAINIAPTAIESEEAVGEPGQEEEVEV
jgi:hypothetical protein